MRELLDAIGRMPDGWLRLLYAAPRPKEVTLLFGLGRRGSRKVAQAYRVECLRVLDVSIGGVDGGGLRLYSSSHPAARQYSDPPMKLKLMSPSSGAVGAIVQAHSRVADDWIPVERYLAPLLAGGAGPITIKGPHFLLRAYARALPRGVAHLVPGRVVQRGRSRAKVLHFSESFVVAEAFKTERLA